MKKIMKNEKGFTMVELILVITILGILAVAALPQFINVTSSANTAAKEGVLGAVREGIALSMSNAAATTGTATPPASLEGADAGTLFDGVITNGVSDSHWTVDGTGFIYTYTANDGSTTAYTYTPATGALN